MTGEIRLRRLGRADYDGVWRSMVAHTAARDAETPDELWLCEHFPVYTLGQAGNPEDLLVENGIPLIRSDRGGQITYHAPGQVVVYLMLDLKRRKLSVHELVRRIEQSVIDLLAAHGVPAGRVEGAPGVYVEKDGGKAKIAALGLRVRRRCCYHGLSLNVDLDLAPFSAINPCGYPGMAVTRTKDLGVALDAAQAGEALAERLIGQLTKSEQRGGE
ncbi:MAG: lipoyl(octanoyl) transferase LipB [Candidatus Accumulibacter sp.]|nr:lipoyl(octanoyl) transferase LipB [Accumulibacter sp.]